MPEDGLKLCNVAVMADQAEQVDLLVPVERLQRLAPLLTRRDGMVTASVALRREQGRMVADVALQVRLEVRCQRCLETMPLPVETRSQVVLLESEADAAAVPAELETALAPGGRMHLAELVEEELLLALPAAPRHPAGQCPAVQPDAGQESDAESAQRPFAGLAGLLRPDRSKQ